MHRALVVTNMVPLYHINVDAKNPFQFFTITKGVNEGYNLAK